MRTSSTIPFAIAVSGVILAVAIYVSIPKNQPTAPGSGNPALIRPVDASDHVLGNPAAPVMIVEYADFDCTYCKGFDETLHEIIASEGTTGRVAWVYREFPLTEIHPNALQNAEAAECIARVAGNDAFWDFKTELFANQPVDPTLYGTYAKNIGITGDAFATCFAQASTTVAARILADRQNALAIGAQGTPYSLILAANKAPIIIDAAYPYSVLKAFLDQALANQSPSR